MRRFTKLLSMVSLGLGLSACWPPEIVPDVQTFSKQLTDADGDGFMTSPECDPTMPTPFCWWVPTIEDPGCVISPNPGGCAVIQWEQTITLDANGWFTYDTSETCLDADGNPIGETQTETGADTPPVDCWQLDEYCWECYTSDGEVFSACVEPTEYCESDEDCTNGESCIVYPEAECPPNALCAPDFGVGVCGVDPNIYCNVNEECPDGYACTPNDDAPCQDEACFFDEQFFAGICTPSQEEGCDANTTANGCEENPSCDWIPDQGVACFTEPCDFGTCVDAQPTDPCESYGDPDSCNADFNNLCGWVEDPTIVCVTEPCYQGSCHNVGCGDVANP